MRRHSISRRLKDYQVNIYKEIPFEIDNFTITAFEVMHDGTDNAGFFIEHDDRAFTIATDLGSISERADHYMRRADYLVIESNYDLNMLRFGNYPEYLKSRIRNVNGHMDNNDTAEYLAKIYTDKLKYVFLCHLSADNNTPEEALKASRTALEGIGVTIGNGEDTVSDRAAQLQLVALPRLESSRMYTLRSI
jgi:phosphoribosyl 1,2-cyclic phosphodiesterase